MIERVSLFKRARRFWNRFPFNSSSDYRAGLSALWLSLLEVLILTLPTDRRIGNERQNCAKKCINESVIVAGLRHQQVP
ncbi:MAG: hypothetical protein OCU22_09720 [Canidatus Methanoxibalbensis ujae]|nr:hypothetical protein [Candidatus Methanoxibalbensis ujae]